MRRNIGRYALLLGILIVAVVLRFWQLGIVPASPDWDEVALGYNAFSIWKTGVDEYGTKFPLVLRSFDDYKPPLYAYLAIMPIALFGLNVWSIRIPSAIFGVLAVFGTYLLVKELFGRTQATSDQRKHVWEESSTEWVALLSAFLLAISPWHIQFSRIAFEANIGITLNIWAIYSILRGFRSPRWFFAGAILSGLGMYAYHSERVFLPLIVISIVVLFRQEILRVKRHVVGAAIVGLLVVLPLVPVIVDKTAWTRLRGTSSLSDTTGVLARSVAKLEDDLARGDYLGRIFENRRIVYGKILLDGYLSHFSLRWLFLTGDNDRHHAPNMGVLYLWELPFVLWGIYTLWKRNSKASKFLLTWFLIAPIPASPTSEIPHAIRSMVFLPTFQIFVAIGLVQLHALLSRTGGLIRFVSFVFVGLMISGNVLYYLHMYFGHTNREFSQFWQYGYREAVAYAKENRQKYRKIVVSSKLEQPHMFFLFYLSYDPSTYQREGGTRSGGFAEYRNQFDVYEFRPIQWEQEIHDGSILYIGTPWEIQGSIMKYINYLDGKGAIRIAQ